MENPNQNITDKPELNPQGQQPQAGEAKLAGSEQDYLFFNVMPKNEAVGGLVQPTLTGEEQAPAETSKEGLKNFFKKYKLYFIIGAVLLIGGPGIYFLVTKIGGYSYQTEDILIKNPSQNLKPAAGQNQPETGFTTGQDWRDKYFPNCADASLCGDNADADHDGLTNLEEFKLTTDPNNNDSDQDGLADGDEANVFGSNPLSLHSTSDAKYSDADYFKGGYDIGTGKKMAEPQKTALSEKMKKFGLHQPTLKTLGELVNTLYNFSNLPQNSSATSSQSSNLDSSIEAKQDRDAQRTNTIKNIGAALVKYQADNKSYPVTTDFPTMFANVKAYLKVATNPIDPVNKDPYIYSYTSQDGIGDFTLTFFSEVAGQPIKKHAADAVKDSNTEQAAIYDNQRQSDLESLRIALLLYSQNNVAGTQDYVFPANDKYKTAIVPQFISQIPKDPKTGTDYEYQVSGTFDTFTLKVVLDSPSTGTSGYLCNQEECRNY